MQRWKKQGLIYQSPPGRSHAQVPTPDGQRIYFGSRDGQNRTSIMALDIDWPARVSRVYEEPILSPGALGCFDDSGAMPSCVVTSGGQKFFFYIGWNTSTTVPYRNAIGLAIGDGTRFERAFEGPILERHAREPHFCATPFVLLENCWRMWYLSCTEWQLIDGKPEPRYLIRYTESDNGIDWKRPGEIAIDYLHPDEAIARPWVVKDGSLYRMWYCFRSIVAYRNNSAGSYRLGYAESPDGLRWKRLDDVVDLPLSINGWDSSMMAYPAILDWNEKRYLLYNGNGFGATGFGIAALQNGSLMAS
jgi:hypothetical protein